MEKLTYEQVARSVEELKRRGEQGTDEYKALKGLRDNLLATEEFFCEDCGEDSEILVEPNSDEPLMCAACGWAERVITKRESERVDKVMAERSTNSARQENFIKSMLGVDIDD